MTRAALCTSYSYDLLRGRQVFMSWRGYLEMKGFLMNYNLDPIVKCSAHSAHVARARKAGLYIKSTENAAAPLARVSGHCHGN